MAAFLIEMDKQIGYERTFIELLALISVAMYDFRKEDDSSTKLFQLEVMKKLSPLVLESFHHKRIQSWKRPESQKLGHLQVEV